MHKYWFECLFSIWGGYTLSIGVVGSYGNLMFNIFRTVKLFSEVTTRLQHLLYPSAVYDGSQFLHPLTSTCY